MTTALTVHSSIRTLVSTFHEAEANMRTAFSMIVAAQNTLDAVFNLDGHGQNLRIEASRRGGDDDFTDPDRAIARMSRAAWHLIVDRLELRRAMSMKRYAQLEKQLRDGELPPITQENVERFVEDCMANLPDMLEDAIGEVFEWLRPRAGTRTGDLKTNTEMEIGSKVILGWMVRGAHSGGGYRVQYGQADQQLTALENVFHALDGRGQIGREHYSLLHRAIEECGPSGVGSTDLFEFKCFRNGNLHLKTKRPDLIAKLNAVAGGMRLRPKKEAA